MLLKSLQEHQHRWVYVIGLSMTVVGLPLSKFLLSLSLFWIALNWIWEGDWREKFRRLRSTPAILILVSVFLLHLLGMLYTDDQAEGWKDIRIKLPMLLLPIFIGTSKPLQRKEFYIVLGVFTAAVFISTITTMFRAAGLVNVELKDLRAASAFVMLIRLGLMVVLAVFFLMYITVRSGIPMYVRIAGALLTCWFVFFLVYMQALTGLVILFATGFILIVVYAFRHRKRLLIAGLFTVFAGASTYAFLEIRKVYTIFYEKVEPVDWKHLAIYSPDGGIYFHYPNHHMLENGHYVMAYISWSELEKEWSRRSKIPFGGTDGKGNNVAYTLLRYMSSKGLHKDADGMSKLSAADISAVEAGCTNYRLPLMSGIERRLYQVLWEMDVYLNGGDPTGNSVTMRLEFWRAAEALIADHPLTGVGTGDAHPDMIEKLVSLGTQLDPQYFWMHTHNQFLSIGMAFGLPGLLLFLFSLFGPPLLERRFRSYFYLSFFCLILFSFLNEDTFETSQGLVFYAFFNSLFLFAQPGGRGQVIEKNLNPPIAQIDPDEQVKLRSSAYAAQ